VANFGAFVDLGGDIEGMIHVGDITNEKRLEHPKEKLAVGQIVKAQVTELDDERRRVRLSMKTLEPTSADEYIAEHKVGDVVTGRVTETHANSAKIELAEGVKGVCRIKVEEKPAAAAPAAAPAAKSSPAADVGSLSAMLAAKWKSGAVAGAGSSSSAAAAPNDPGGLRQGQVRQFPYFRAHSREKNRSNSRSCRAANAGRSRLSGGFRLVAPPKFTQPVRARTGDDCGLCRPLTVVDEPDLWS
jgi:small subunit ribosomal protein S1